jgi:nucleotide-binding universal stress UspA family protein
VVVLSGGVLRRGLGVGIAADLNKRSKQGIMDTKLVLAAVDFSPVSDEVCRVAADLAASIGARAVVLHVSEPEVDYVGVAPPELFPMTQDTAVQVIEGRLRAAREIFQGRSVSAEVLHLWGPIVGTIISEVERNQADMVVLGSHGHGAFYNLIVGSVAEGVIRHSKVPVLVVPVRAGKKVVSEPHSEAEVQGAPQEGAHVAVQGLLV